MSVRTKKLPTNIQCTLAFMGPATQAEAARVALQALGFRAIEHDTPSQSTAHHAARTSKAGRFLQGPLGTGAPLRHAQEPEQDATLSQSVPWQEAFPPLDEATRPGRMLRAARTKEDVTQLQLATLTGIPQRHLSEMERGKRGIGKERAKKLAAVLQVNYRLFL